MSQPVEIRIKTKIPAEEMAEKVGKVLTEGDFNLVPTGDVVIRKPTGEILLVYRRGIIPPELRESTYPILHELKRVVTANRGLASGSKRVELPSGKRSEAKRVASAIVGGFDPQGPRKYCRLTAWTGRETAKMQILHPLLQFISARMEIDAPDRYAAQATEIARTHPDWVIPGTVFSTVTVNNTYETGVHKDAGDLDTGISTLAVLRRGDFKGGVLVFPEYRVGVDMQDGDLLLMDAHEWHGNTFFDPPIEWTTSGKPKVEPAFERISVVSYFRTNMVKCSSLPDEESKRIALTEERNLARIGQ